MKPLSSLIKRIGTETGFVVSSEIAKLENEGWNITRLTLGEPNGNIPSPATKAIKESLDRHETHYGASKGFQKLREEIAKYVSVTRGVDYSAEDVTLTPGGKTVICQTIMSYVDHGDEVIVPSPGYPVYESMVNLMGGKVVKVPILEEKDFTFDVNVLKKLVTPKTKLLVLNSPQNPTGGVLNKEDIKEIAEIVRKNDLYVLSDEIYSRIVYGKGFDTVEFKGNKFPIAPSIASLPDMAERTIILDGFSKTYAMTGMRVGFGCTKNKEWNYYAVNIAINYWACLPLPCQMAALACLGEDQTEAMSDCKALEEKRDIVVDGLNKIKDIKCKKPKGSFYSFVNVTKVCKNLGLKNSEALRKYLLTYDKKNKRGMGVLSRQHFGERRPDETEEYIRISFAGSKETLREGVARMKDAIENPRL
ncbi:MAG: aminotransferase class I/II-fold pyridoxal phosphate-dependent enzyme [Thermoplasmata archaeon]